MRSVQLGTITTTVWLLSLLAQTTLARVLPASQLPVRRAGEGVNGGRHSTISIIQPRAMGEKFNPLEYFDDDDLELDSFNRCVDDCEQGKIKKYLLRKDRNRRYDGIFFQRINAQCLAGCDHLLKLKAKPISFSSSSPSSSSSSSASSTTREDSDTSTSTHRRPSTDGGNDRTLGMIFDGAARVRRTMLQPGSMWPKGMKMLPVNALR